MDEEEFLDLFEIYWFYHNTTPNPSSPPFTPPSSPPSIPPKSDSCSEEPTVSRLNTLRRRSHSDQSLSSVSPDSVLPTTPKLDTIPSGKDRTEFTEKTADPGVATPSKKAAGLGREKRQKKKMSKSLSDLEFEELKGLMDLGFTFPEAEVDSRLMSIVPGLQRWGKNSGKEETEIHDRAAVSRPYLSEAWPVDPQEVDPLSNWKISAVVDGADLKNQLRSSIDGQMTRFAVSALDFFCFFSKKHLRPVNVRPPWVTTRTMSVLPSRDCCLSAKRFGSISKYLEQWLRSVLVRDSAFSVRQHVTCVLECYSWLARQTFL
ncbi:hypothetical protein ACLOJK_010607 [Asimina triloba]